MAGVCSKWIRGAFGLAVLICGPLGAAGAAQSNSQPQSVSLPLESSAERLVVRAQVNGSNSVWLMLDTGFSITTIDPRLAELLQLKPIGKTAIAGIAGEEQADLFRGPQFDFGGISYTPRRVAALPSERKKRARRMEGILGAGFFRQFVIQVDFQAKIVQLHSPKDYNYPGGGEVVPLKFRNSTAIAEALINIPGRPAVRGQFEIDTGCDSGLCLGHDFVMANKLLELGGRTQIGGRTGVGGDAKTKLGSVPQLQLGRFTVDKPETNFFLEGSPVEGHLAGHIGIEVLRQFKVIFDYSRQRLILEPVNKPSAPVSP